ncbi:hypothetical protein BH18ACI5_BH18ACI5_18230 [soil metagenome]
MTIQDWLRNAVEDARQRGLPALEPLLESLARSTTALRDADRAARLPDQRSASDQPTPNR